MTSAVTSLLFEKGSLVGSKNIYSFYSSSHHYLIMLNKVNHVDRQQEEVNPRKKSEVYVMLLLFLFTYTEASSNPKDMLFVLPSSLLVR
jgi:hypothetical protein